MRRGPYKRRIQEEPPDKLDVAETALKQAAAAHVDSRSHQGDSEAIGRLIAAAQAAAGSGMSLREIAQLIDSGAREQVVGDPQNGAAVPQNGAAVPQNGTADQLEQAA
jgi:hypothetical protein